MTFDPTGLDLNIEIGSGANMVPLQTWFMQWRNIGDFFDPPERRGDDKLIPHVPGVKAMPRRTAKTVRVLEGLIAGDVDVHNAPYADAVAGLESNIAYVSYYCDSLWSPAADSTRTVRKRSLVSIKYGPAHVRLTTGRIVGRGKKLATLEISMPEGGLFH